MSPLEIACGEVPPGAVDTWFEHVITATGGEGAHWFVADGLPPGLNLSYGAARIHGRPEEAGSYDVRVRVGDTTGARVETTCRIEVCPTFALDLAPLYDRPGGCLAPGESLLDLLAPGTGDDSPITCAWAGDSADGPLPAGLAVDPTACTVTGALTDPTYGNWAFVVTAEQAGMTVHAPFCVPQPEHTGRYDRYVKHGDLDQGALVPWMDVVPARSTLSTRVDAGDALPFVVLDEAGCAGGCYWSAWWGLERSAVSSSSMATEALAGIQSGRYTVGIEHGFVIDRAWLREDRTPARSWCSSTSCTASRRGAPTAPPKSRRWRRATGSRSGGCSCPRGWRRRSRAQKTSFALTCSSPPSRVHRYSAASRSPSTSQRPYTANPSGVGSTQYTPRRSVGGDQPMRSQSAPPSHRRSARPGGGAGAPIAPGRAPWAASYASTAVAMDSTVLGTSARLARSCIATKLGMAMAATMPMAGTASTSSPPRARTTIRAVGSLFFMGPLRAAAPPAPT